MARFVVALSLSLFAASLALAQNPPASDPQALSFVAQSIAAMTQGAAITDVTITGNATWIAGSDHETGQLTLRAKGYAESRIDFNLSSGTHSDIRNDNGGLPQGAVIRADGSLRPLPLHNCWINASWFFPASSFLSVTSDPTLIFSYVGQENHEGTSVQHLRVSRYLTGQRTSEIALPQ